VPALREALAGKIELLYGRRYDPVTRSRSPTGATEALFASLTAVVRPGDEVVLFEPAYDSYLPAVQLSGGIRGSSRCAIPDYRIDWDDVRRAVGPKTRAVVINTPHNPTGMMWTATTCGSCPRRPRRHRAVVISDEVYEHVRFDGHRHESVARYPALAERALVIRSFGKTYHTTGLEGRLLRRPARAVKEVSASASGSPSRQRCRAMAYAGRGDAQSRCDDVTSFYEGGAPASSS
jgi:methionine aminotransferase